MPFSAYGGLAARSASMLVTRSRLFAPPRKVRVHGFDLRDVRNGLSARVAVEVHYPLGGLGEGRPFGEARPIGISVLREVCPVSAHEVRNRNVFGFRRGASPSQIVEHVADLGRVRRAVRSSR